MGLLHSARAQGLFLQPEEIQQGQVVGNYFLRTFVALNRQYLNSCPFRLFHCRPKLHLVAHMVDDLSNQRNPVVDCLWMDENWIGQIMHLAKKTHSRRTHASTLFRYCAGLSHLFCFFLSCLLFAGLKAALREGMKILVRASVLPFVGASVS